MAAQIQSASSERASWMPKASQNPASLKVCSLLIRDGGQESAVPIDYEGFLRTSPPSGGDIALDDSVRPSWFGSDATITLRELLDHLVPVDEIRLTGAALIAEEKIPLGTTPAYGSDRKSVV